MKEYNGIQSPFDNAIVPVPGGQGDKASSDPGVPVRDAPSTTGSKVGPMALTMDLGAGDAMAEGKKIKGS